MSRFTPKFDSHLPCDVRGKRINRSYIANFQVAAVAAVATSAAGVLAATNLGAEVQDKITGITNPAAPRVLSIVGNVAGITGDVVITGKNYAGEEIAETLSLNGVTTVNGNKAFKAIDNINLPVQVHTPIAQVETATVTGTITTAGNATVTVTAAGMTGSPKAISVAVALADNASAIAGKIRTALTTDAAVAAMFTVSGIGVYAVLTRKTPAANDATLNIAVADGTCVGITPAASSADTTAGVPYDTVSVGWNDKLGLPYKLAHNTVIRTYLDNTLEATAPMVTVSATAIESNTIDLDSALAGKVVDAYLIV